MNKANKALRLTLFQRLNANKKQLSNLAFVKKNFHFTKQTSQAKTNKTQYMPLTLSYLLPPWWEVLGLRAPTWLRAAVGVVVRFLRVVRALVPPGAPVSAFVLML